MTVLVDTSVWSLALRRRPEQLSPRELGVVDAWQRLVRGGRVALIGAIRQEILSGIRNEIAFTALRDRLNDFLTLEVDLGDHDRAARFFNLLRTRGIAATPIDLLICAVACRQRVPIFTLDGDFERYAPHLPIELVPVPKPPDS